MGVLRSRSLGLCVLLSLLCALSVSGVELVSYCTTWSGDCKSLATELNKLRQTKGSILSENKIIIKEVDADKEPDLILRERITRYPTLRLYTDHFQSTFEHTNDYTSQAIFDFLHRTVIQSVRPSTNLETDVKTWLSKGYSPVVYQGPTDGGNSDSAFSVFKTVSGILANSRHQVFLYAKNSNQKNATLEYFTLKNEKLTFNQTWNLNNVLTFASNSPRGRVVSCLDTQRMSPIFDKEHTGIILFADGQVPQEYLSAFKQLASNSTSKKRVFAICDATDQEARDLYLSYFGFTKFPTVGILDHFKHELLKYNLNGATGEELTHQFESFNNRNYPLFYKSQEVPASNEGPVTVLVGSNYEATVQSPDVHFLVLVTSSVECSKCKAAEETFSAFAEKYQKDHRIRFAKIDFAHNDIPHLADPDLPGALLYLKDAKQAPIHSGKKVTDKTLGALLRKHTNLPG